MGDELLILAPRAEADDPLKQWSIAGMPAFTVQGETRFGQLVRFVVEAGISFPFDEMQRLPRDLPEALSSFKAVMIDFDRRDEFCTPAMRSRLRAFEEQGGRVIMCRIGGLPDDMGDYVTALAESVGLMKNNPHMQAKLSAVSDNFLQQWWCDSIVEQGETFRRIDAGWAWGDPIAYHYYWPAWEAAAFFERPELMSAAWALMKDGFDKSKWAGKISCGRRFALRYYEAYGDQAILDRCIEEMGEHAATAANIKCDGNDIYPPGFEETPLWLNNEDLGNCGENLSYFTKVTGDEIYRTACCRIFDEIKRTCWDRDSQLWLHRGHVDRGPVPEESGAWGRGNGWVLYGLRGMLEDMPEAHPERPKLISALADTLEGFLRHQRSSGLWTSLITARDGEGRDECSGTWMAVLVFARAYWKGWLRDERIPAMCEKAWQGLKTKLWRGLPVAMCFGTPRFPAPEYYNSSTFGGFMGMPLLLATIEIERMRRCSSSTHCRGLSHPDVAQHSERHVLRRA